MDRRRQRSEISTEEWRTWEWLDVTRLGEIEKMYARGQMREAAPAPEKDYFSDESEMYLPRERAVDRF